MQNKKTQSQNCFLITKLQQAQTQHSHLEIHSIANKIDKIN